VPGQATRTTATSGAGGAGEGELSDDRSTVTTDRAISPVGSGWRSRAGRPPSRSLRSVLRGVVGVLAILAAAQLLIGVGLVGGDTLPTPTAVIGRMVSLAGDSAFRSAVAATIVAWALGLAIAVAISVPLGLLLGLSDVTARAAGPVIELLRPLPAVALIPLAILVWGQGLTMKLVLIVYATVWPILFNAIHGVHDVEADAVDAARAFGLGRRAIIRRVILPSAAPFVLTGIRISASIGLIVLVGAELLAGAQTGIGAFIFRLSANTSRPDEVLGAAAYAGLLGLLINTALAAIDRRLFAWQYRSEAGETAGAGR
jgi:NitT/TauT family transport system permease protein